MIALLILIAASLTSRAELLKTIQSIRPHKDVSDPNPSKAHKPKVCKCGSDVWINEDDGLDERCGICGKWRGK